MQGLPVCKTDHQKLSDPPAPERYWRWIFLVLLVTALGMLPVLSSAELVVLDGSKGQIPVSHQLLSLRDPEGKLDVDAMLRPETNWQAATGSAVNYGIDPSDWWFRIDIRNEDPANQEYLLEIAYASLDHIAIYVADGQKILNRHLLGDQRPFHDRPINHHFFVVPTELPVDQTRTLLIHVRTNGVVQLPLSLWKKGEFTSHDQIRQLVAGVYFGAMLVMLIYNLFMFIGIGDRSYLYYVGFVLSVPMFVSSLTGYSFQYFWPNSVKWNGQSIGFFLTSTVMFALLFTHEFLQLKRESLPALIRTGSRIVFIIGVFMMTTVFLASYNVMLISVIAGGTLGCVAALFIGIFGTMRGERPAIFYVLAWSSLFLGGLILAASKLALLPQNTFTDNAIQIGSIMLVVLLSFALAERINQERRRRYDAQMEALQNERQARQAKEQALNAQQEANLQLEHKVTQRTEELAKANAVLQELSDSDGLTGLRNRRYLDSYLDREVTRCFRYQHSLALILLDIDHFKQFNDRFGHHIGDDCLRMVAEQLRHCVARDSDIVARYGGEEFCIVLPETEMDGARAVAERIRRRIAETPFPVAGDNITVTISAGVTCAVPTSPGHGAYLLQRADEGLYQSKHEGRNRVTCLPG
ncbi:MAG: diguanylate cyclase [Alcanivoracaceae bacterium]|jgi:diguanylate cyclase|nr:diguanylate cyclase [Alcanivoracaceae bacterium]